MNTDENIKNFYNYLSNHKGLQKKLSKKVQKRESNDIVLDNIVKLANKKDYNFTILELKDFIKRKTAELSQKEKINEEKLKNVAGGMKNQTIIIYKI